MEILRYSRDVYGQRILEGASWDLLWPCIGVAAVIICGHLIYRLIRPVQNTR